MYLYTSISLSWIPTELELDIQLIPLSKISFFGYAVSLYLDFEDSITHGYIGKKSLFLPLSFSFSLSLSLSPSHLSLSLFLSHSLSISIYLSLPFANYLSFSISISFQKINFFPRLWTFSSLFYTHSLNHKLPHTPSLNTQQDNSNSGSMIYLSTIYRKNMEPDVLKWISPDICLGRKGSIIG